MVKQTNEPLLRFPGFTKVWDTKQLGKVTCINPSNQTLPDKFIYIDLGSVENGQLNRESIIFKTDAPSRAQRVLSTGDILFQMVRPYKKNNLYFDRKGDFVASTGYAQIRAKQDSLFVYHYLHFQKFVEKVIERCTGTGYPSINSTDLSNITISLPTLPEQQKIASFLTAIDNRLQLLKKKQTMLEQYKNGVMKKLFSQELRFKDEDGREFPKWEKMRLREIGNFIGGGTPSTSKREYWEGSVPWISSSDISEDSIYTINCNRFITLEAVSKSATKILPPKSILIVSRVGVGKIAVSEVELCTSQDFTSLVLDSDNHIFIAYLLKEKTKELIAFNQGTSIKGFVKSDLQEMQISRPTIKEQNLIALFLSSLDKKLSDNNALIEQTTQFKKGLLQKMFC